MRLIDADALPVVVGTQSELPNMIVKAIQDAPTIDAVHVVRCKDCKWWELSQYNTAGIHICGKFCGVRGEHDFCSRGERKDDE